MNTRTKQTNKLAAPRQHQDSQNSAHLSLLLCTCSASALEILTCDRVSCNTKNPSRAANKQTATNKKQRTKISRVHENQ